MNSFIKDLFSVGISKVLIIIFGLSTSILIARTLGPDKNGQIASLLVYPSLFISIGSLGIRQSVTYFFGKKIFEEAKIKTAITQIWFVSALISLISCYFLLTELGKGYDNLNYVWLILASIPFNLFNIYNSGIFLGKNDISSFNKINWIPSFIVLIATILFVYKIQLDIFGYLLAMLFGPMFISLYLLINQKFISFFSLKIDKTIIKSLLSLGIIYALSLLVIGLNYKLDVILLNLLSTNYETGIYSKGTGVAEYLWQIPMLLSTIVFARSAVSKDDYLFSIKTIQLLRVSFVFICFGSIFLFIFADIVITLMFGDDFFPSANVLKILLPGVLLMTIFKVMNMDLAGKGKPWVSMKAMLPALFINVILNVILIPSGGANGAAIASTISYVFAAILYVILYSIETKIPIIQIITFKKSDFDFLKKIFKK